MLLFDITLSCDYEHFIMQPCQYLHIMCNVIMCRLCIMCRLWTLQIVRRCDVQIAYLRGVEIKSELFTLFLWFWIQMVWLYNEKSLHLKHNKIQVSISKLYLSKHISLCVVPWCIFSRNLIFSTSTNINLIYFARKGNWQVHSPRSAGPHLYKL